MNSSVALEKLLKRDRLVILAGIIGITLVTWAYMLYEARGMTLTGACHCAGLKMSGPDLAPWSMAVLVPLFLMWTEMMVAMMLPSAAPMLLIFGALNRNRREQDSPYVPVGVFLLGYLAIWTAFSALAAIAQWALHGAALLSPTMASTSRLLSGALLLAAGVFQWTSLKRVCLVHCRTPLSFLMAGWRDGRLGAFLMGLRHGAYCSGCCWLLMALLFVAGVMNMWWVAMIAALVLAEKVAPKGLGFGKVVGVLWIVWGLWFVVGAV
jgi:predicted metal-binding membrane protein